MNLLSIGAAYGVMVAVFQWGWLGDADRRRQGRRPIEPWAPMMLFAIVFGLSMDYEVFLLSPHQGGVRRAPATTATAVAEGLASTARVITAAAAIMVCVFGSFVLGDVRAIKLIGLGLAVAVLIDATIVRMVLVPATMELLGDATGGCPAGSTGSSPASPSNAIRPSPGPTASTSPDLAGSPLPPPRPVDVAEHEPVAAGR